LAAGCRRTSVDYIDLSGKVLHKGRPLPGGEVNFITVDGFPSKGRIDEKGNYKISAPLGEVRISVDNRMLEKVRSSTPIPKEAPMRGAGRPDAGAPDPVKGTYVEINGKYYDPSTSGLIYTVTKGETTHDIELPD
jgi:hypothetical protein